MGTKCFTITCDECFTTLKHPGTHGAHAVGKLDDVFIFIIRLFTKLKTRLSFVWFSFEIGSSYCIGQAHLQPRESPASAY